MIDAPPAAAETSRAQPIVAVRGLKKSYGRREILHGLDFDIPAGRIYGLIGHNGAGKTTTINALLGLTPADGKVSVLGREPFASRARLMRDVAFISDIASLPRYLTVTDLMRLVADIHPNFSRERAIELLADTDIRPRVRIGTLSKGMMTQLHLAVVMAINARLLVLDEPTLGLDITFRKRFYRRLVEDYMRPDRAILITTHQVDEIEFMLTDLMFIRDGRLVLDMPMRAVGTRFSQLIVDPASAASAAALNPVFTETRFGQTVMVYDGADRAALEPLGTASTPTVSDLFVALMQRQPARGTAAK